MARDIETRIEGTVLREESLVNGSGRGALLHEEFTGPIIGAFYDVYNELGTGFVESVYERRDGNCTRYNQAPFRAAATV